ncbi:hypothetical protein AXG93_4368s2390 [Marchantia polymorpha subsp. ruderalis]|uniref:Uncharacterized protein n=1 Tax=Marchantia polymorpha subsp. ruderalis TaxID=1480154 RepID=A0A176VY97_MARPO|nr:hypothetical protein AXG93_4368s2390 [Marchantia polymorpha subsp. ruderalis]
MDQWSLSYEVMKLRPCFPKSLVQYSAEGIRPSVLESSELPTKDFRRRIPIEVKDGATRERNLNGVTFNSHKLALPMRQQTILAGATANVRARKKMKVRRLIIVDDSNTEGSVVASQGRLTSAEWAELEADVARTKRKLETEETQSGGINATDVLCKKLVPLLCYLDEKLEKYAGSCDVGSYVKLVRNMTCVKVAAATMTAEQVESLTIERVATKALLEEKKKRLQGSELDCATL